MANEERRPSRVADWGASGADFKRVILPLHFVKSTPDTDILWREGGEGGGSLWRSTQIQLDNSQAAMVEDPVNTSGGRRGAVVVVVLGGIVLVEQFGHPHSSEGVDHE